MTLHFLLEERIFDVRRNLGELYFSGGDFFQALNQMITEAGRNDVADLIGIEREGGGFEFLHEGVGAREGVFALVLLQATIFGKFLDELGKILTSSGAREQLFDLLALDFFLFRRK